MKLESDVKRERGRSTTVNRAVANLTETYQSVCEHEEKDWRTETQMVKLNTISVFLPQIRFFLA